MAAPFSRASMETIHPNTFTVLLLSLALLLGAARVFGELAHRLSQPAVLGELLAGILLGPTVLRPVAPEVNAFLFPPGRTKRLRPHDHHRLAVTLFLMVAGLEVDLSNVWRKGWVGLKVGVASIVIPFAAGFFAAWNLPSFFGAQPEVDPLLFALFLAIAMSISALPVIVKTLLDMNLFRSDFGVVVVSAAIFNDLVGWIVFAVVLGLSDNVADISHGITRTVILALGFVLLVFTAGRKMIHRILPYVQAYTWWPGGEIGFVVILTLLGAAFTEWIGIHAIFGAFFIGMAVGDSPYLRRRSRYILDQFVSSVFSPIFFASIGLKVNFIAHFDGTLVLDRLRHRLCLQAVWRRVRREMGADAPPGSFGGWLCHEFPGSHGDHPRPARPGTGNHPSGVICRLGHHGHFDLDDERADDAVDPPSGTQGAAGGFVPLRDFSCPGLEAGSMKAVIEEMAAPSAGYSRAGWNRTASTGCIAPPRMWPARPVVNDVCCWPPGWTISAGLMSSPASRHRELACPARMRRGPMWSS